MKKFVCSKGRLHHACFYILIALSLFLSACGGPLAKAGKAQIWLALHIPEWPNGLAESSLTSRVLLPETTKVEVIFSRNDTAVLTMNAVQEQADLFTCLTEELPTGTYTIEVTAADAQGVYASASQTIALQSGETSLAMVLLPDNPVLLSSGYSASRSFAAGTTEIYSFSAPSSGTYTLVAEGAPASTMAWGSDGRKLSGHNGAPLAVFNGLAAGESGYLAVPGPATVRPRLARSPAGTLDTGFGSAGRASLYSIPNISSEDSMIKMMSYNSTAYAVGSSDGQAFVAAFNLGTGNLDPAFAGKGWLFLDHFGVDNISLWDCAIQNAGGINRLIVAGTALNAGSNYSFVARLNLDGSLDTDFGSGGYWIDSIARGNTEAYCEVNSAGQILLAYTTSTPAAAVLRLSANGSLDTGFGASGRITVPSSWTPCQELALDSLDNIYLAYTYNSGESIGIVKLDTNGDAIAGFGQTRTFVTNPLVDTIDLPMGVVGSLGAFIIFEDLLYVSYHENTNDNLFVFSSSDGDIAYINYLTATSLYSSGIAVAPGGSPIYWGGSTDTGDAWCGKIIVNANILELAADGFNSTAPTHRTYTEADSFASVLLANGNLVMGGNWGLGINKNLQLVSANPSTGAVLGAQTGDQTTLGVQELQLNDSLVLSDGSIMVCGSIYNGSADTAIAMKLDNSGQPDSTFGNSAYKGLYTSPPVSTESNYFTAVAEAPNGYLLLAGYSNDSGSLTPQLHLVDSSGQKIGSWIIDSGLFPANTIFTGVAVQPDGAGDVVLASAICDYTGTPYGTASLFVANGLRDAMVSGTEWSAGNGSFDCVAAPDGSFLVSSVDGNLKISRFTYAGTSSYTLTESEIAIIDNVPSYENVGLAVNTDGRWYLAADRTTSPESVRVATGLLSDLPGTLASTLLSGYDTMDYTKIAVHPDGRLFLALSFVGNTQAPRLLALGTDLQPDSDFGSGGYLALPYNSTGNPEGLTRLVAIAPDGTVLVGGRLITDNGDSKLGWLQVAQ